jgi:predicted transcriptional regulator
LGTVSEEVLLKLNNEIIPKGPLNYLYLIVDESIVSNINLFKFTYRRLLRSEKVNIYYCDCNVFSIMSSVIMGDNYGCIRLDNDKFMGEYSDTQDILDINYFRDIFSYRAIVKISPL